MRGENKLEVEHQFAALLELFDWDLVVAQTLAVPGDPFAFTIYPFTIYPFTIYHLSLWTLGADDHGGALVCSEVQRHTVEEGREEFVDGFADDQRIHPDAGEDVPGTHGAVVLIHLWAVAARLVRKGTADEGRRVGIVAAIAVGDGLRGQAADNACCLFGHPQSAEEEGHMDVRLVALVVEFFAEEGL